MVPRAAAEVALESEAHLAVGVGFSSRSETTAMTIPAVQKPHWSVWFSWNACWIGCSSSADGASPSMVVIEPPSAWAANIVHDFTDSPSIRIVHVPHDEVSHPIFVPVRPQFSRQVVHQKGPRLYVVLLHAAVDRHRNLHAVPLLSKGSSP